jgi:predicted Zn-dependent protease
LGEGATEAFRDRLDRLAPRISMTVIRDSIVRSVAIARDTVCDYDVTVARKDVVNAAADGKTVYVNSGLLRFISDDDELAAVVGHEIAHNAMHHMDAKKTNALVGALVGMIFDVAAAKHGVSTDMSNQMAAAGAMVFSADFEREADYVGVYIMLAAIRPPRPTCGDVSPKSSQARSRWPRAIPPAPSGSFDWINGRTRSTSASAPVCPSALP